MTFKVSDNQYGRPHPSDNWASCVLMFYAWLWAPTGAALTFCVRSRLRRRKPGVSRQRPSGKLVGRACWRRWTTCPSSVQSTRTLVPRQLLNRDWKARPPDTLRRLHTYGPRHSVSIIKLSTSFY